MPEKKENRLYPSLIIVFFLLFSFLPMIIANDLWPFGRFAVFASKETHPLHPRFRIMAKMIDGKYVNPFLEKLLYPEDMFLMHRALTRALYFDKSMERAEQILKDLYLRDEKRSKIIQFLFIIDDSQRKKVHHEMLETDWKGITVLRYP